MKPRIAVCLLTCNRPHYTERTVASFERHNAGQARFERLHADDASDSDENLRLAEQYGFRTVVANSERRGWLASRIALFERAAAEGFSWVLFLENDIETLRPFPWPIFDRVCKVGGIYCLRLYGRFKDAAKTDKCLETHKRREHMPVQWRPWKDAPEPSQVGVIHWSAQPAVTRVPELLAHHRLGREAGALTVRVKKNVMAHFGVERTIVRPLEVEEACA